jgi:hypothetical protein
MAKIDVFEGTDFSNVLNTISFFSVEAIIEPNE